MSDGTSTSTTNSLKPPLPRTVLEWLRVFGPGAIVASLTIGTGELIFSARGGALFGYNILFVFALILVLKWALVLAASRHMLLTGVHPYERMHELPGPRGWLPIALLLLCAFCMPVWISFHSGVIGNLTSWVTGTLGVMNGAIDYVWGALFLAGVLVLTALGGYSVLERIQLVIVGALVFCAGLTLVLYNPDWVELIFGVVPRRLSYPEWLEGKYPKIAEQTVWVETTRYVGVIGGAGFDYLAYTSWLREKRWGILPARATPEQLEKIAADPQHEVRKWLRAPLIDCTISFGLVIAFSAVFVASGVLILGPNQAVPDEDNFLNLQAKFVTEVHEWLLPIYIAGAYFTMWGTLYGTVEIACAIGAEIARSFTPDWTQPKATRLKRVIVVWCGTFAMAILGWLFVWQSSPPVERNSFRSTASSDRTSSEERNEFRSTDEKAPARTKPRQLLTLLTPVNLITGVLSCAMICFLMIWTDRRHLPRGLRQPVWLLAINVVGGVIFLGLWAKGLWDNKDRGLAIGGMVGVFAVAMAIAAMRRRIAK